MAPPSTGMFLTSSPDGNPRPVLNHGAAADVDQGMAERELLGNVRVAMRLFNVDQLNAFQFITSNRPELARAARGLPPREDNAPRRLADSWRGAQVRSPVDPAAAEQLALVMRGTGPGPDFLDNYRDGAITNGGK